MVHSTQALVPLSERRSTGKKLQERRDGRQNFPNSVRNQVKFCSTPDTSCVRESRRRIIARQRQIEYGYNTIGYARYLQLVPRAARSMNATVHPRTPDPHQKCSKRSYDGQVKKWRRLLHRYDVSEGEHISKQTKKYHLSRPFSTTRSWNHRGSMGKLRQLLRARVINVLLTQGWRESRASPLPLKAKIEVSAASSGTSSKSFVRSSMNFPSLYF